MQSPMPSPSSSLRRHSCADCRKSFEHPWSLKQHSRKHSLKRYVCRAPGCGKRYKWRSSLRSHREACAKKTRNGVSRICREVLQKEVDQPVKGSLIPLLAESPKVPLFVQSASFPLLDSVSYEPKHPAKKDASTSTQVFSESDRPFDIKVANHIDSTRMYANESQVVSSGEVTKWEPATSNDELESCAVQEPCIATPWSCDILDPLPSPCSSSDFDLLLENAMVDAMQGDLRSAASE